MTQANWSEDRVEQLKNLWTEGLSASQIARALGGVTRNAVIGKVHRLGLAGRASPSRADRPRLPSAPKASTLRNAMPPAPVVEDPIEAAARALVLQSTLCGETPLACINGVFLRPGQRVSGFVLEKVEPTRVLLGREGVKVELYLR